MTFLNRIYKNFVSLLMLPLKILLSLKDEVINVKNMMFSLRRHFKILRESNISLAKYHMRNGKFKDAALRFWLIDKFFAPNDNESKYYAAWNSIFLAKYNDAISKLENNSLDKNRLKEYISNISTVEDIPTNLYNEYNELTSTARNQNVDLGDTKISKEIDYIAKKYLNEIDAKTLEIGVQPYSLSLLEEYFIKNNFIDCVTLHDADAKLSEILADNNIYNKVYNKDRAGYYNLHKKYNAIFSFNTLSFTVNLAKHLKHIKGLMLKDGILVFTLPKGNITKLDPSTNSFLYDENYIKNQLNLAELNLESIKVFSFNNNNYYLIVSKC